MNSKKENPNQFLILLISQLYEGLHSAVDLLLEDSDESVRELWLSTLVPGQSIAAALSDANPDNKAQILEIVKQYGNQDVIPLAHSEVLRRIGNIEDVNIRELVTMATNVSFMIAQISTDENPNNLLQIQTYLEDFVESADNQQKVLEGALDPLLDKLFKKQKWLAKLFMTTIESRLAGVNFDFNKDGK